MTLSLIHLSDLEPGDVFHVLDDAGDPAEDGARVLVHTGWQPQVGYQLTWHWRGHPEQLLSRTSHSSDELVLAEVPR